MSDLAGLDIGWDKETSDPKERIRDALVEMGRRGQKTGKGWFDYGSDRQPKESEEVYRLIQQFAGKTKTLLPAPTNEDEILQRGMFAMVNEGARILEEGHASRASDIDVVWLNGYGFPRAKGGPMYWASHEVGLQTIVDKLEQWTKQGATDCKPSALLVKLAKAGQTFEDHDQVKKSKL
jgi:3-hydroxyacyl-CoA dehydrogenase